MVELRQDLAYAFKLEFFFLGKETLKQELNGVELMKGIFIDQKMLIILFIIICYEVFGTVIYCKTFLI